MIDLSTVAQSWRLIGATAFATPGIRVREIGVASSAGELVLGTDQDGYRHLLIPVAMATEVRSDTKSSGVQVNERTLLERDSECRYVDVLCTKPHLFDHFDVIIFEILEGISGGSASADAVAIRVLERWRELLARPKSSIPSLTQLLGLFGELMVLERLVQGEPRAVSWWTGPENTRHDFVAPKGAIEVKTTRANDDWHVTIHGLGQLEPPSRGGLLLAVLKVEPHVKGTSIPDLLQLIVDTCGSRSALMDKLDEAGVSERDLPMLSSHRFELREARYYEIDEDFPRIVAESFATGRLPAGVRGLQYTLDLSSEPPHPIQEEDLDLALENLREPQ